MASVDISLTCEQGLVTSTDLAGAADALAEFDDWLVSKNSFSLPDIKVPGTANSHDSETCEPGLFPQYNCCRLGSRYVSATRKEK